MNSSSQCQTLDSLIIQEEYINITFKKSWYQEDIESLVLMLFSPIAPVNIQEKNIGADREDIRFSWESSYFVLNFDFYSQSCWIEAQDNYSLDKISSLYTALNNIK